MEDTISESTIHTNDEEDHICHVFKLKRGDFGVVEQIEITVPSTLPKKCQVRIPQSNKKDYCRFRFDPISIKIYPSTTGMNILCYYLYTLYYILYSSF